MLVIQRENAAAAAVVALANWVLASPKVLGHSASVFLCCSWIAARSTGWQSFLLCGATVGVLFVCAWIHFCFRNPRHPTLSLYLRSSRNWVEVLCTDHFRSICLVFESVSFTIVSASFALPLSCGSGEVPYILPRAGLLTRIKAAVLKQSNFCFILRCICSSTTGFWLAQTSLSTRAKKTCLDVI